MLLSLNLVNALPLDFSAGNADLMARSPNGQPLLDLTDTAQFSAYVFDKLREAGAEAGIGGYNEHRVIYRRSAHFGEGEAAPREVHLGVDIWAPAGTRVFAPKDGLVHSFQNNAGFGDYGPTIILQHELDGQTVYSLYGHLSLASLKGLYEGKVIKAGEPLAEIGPYPENGDWPPHLHFQLMTDLLGKRGDFPGVCSLPDREKYLAICPDPMEWLR